MIRLDRRRSVRPRRRAERPTRPEPLWRELVGSELRRVRHARSLTLTETAERAGMSPQYLSEVERGRKEVSSEMLAAVAGALRVRVVDLVRQATERPARMPTLAPPSGPVLLAA